MGILEMPDALEVALAGRAPATSRLMHAIVDDVGLAAVLREARAGWRDTCLIHGDLRRENWFAVPSSAASGVRVIDWELSGSGDPAWDLATVIVDAAMEGLRSTGVMGEGPAVAALPRLVRAYAGADGPAIATAGGACWRHLWACAVSRLLHVATEWAERQPGDDLGVVEPLVAHAGAWTRDIARLTEEGVAWAAA
jgi:aminoglycoside phosphotransferase (APT) family kinase protein